MTPFYGGDIWTVRPKDKKTRIARVGADDKHLNCRRSGTAAFRTNSLSAFIGVILWLTLDIFLFGYITNGLVGLSMTTRIIITAILIAPLGFFMGIPFPKGALRVGELVDWGLAVNGAASVLGSAAIILVAMAYGFTVALLVAALVYLLAWILISARRAW